MYLSFISSLNNDGGLLIFTFILISVKNSNVLLSYEVKNLRSMFPLAQVGLPPRRGNTDRGAKNFGGAKNNTFFLSSEFISIP